MRPIKSCRRERNSWKAKFKVWIMMTEMVVQDLTGTLTPLFLMIMFGSPRLMIWRLTFIS
jgi:hypothetical protein